MSKIAIIGIGGGMRSSHGAGFLYALATELQVTNPDIVIGSSGNSANLLYYATQRKDQCEAMKKIWTELLSTPKFISFLRFWRIMDIDYLIDTVFKKEAKLNVEALQNSAIEYYISVVNAKDGSVRYIKKEDKIDTFEILRTTKALPFFYDKKISMPWGRYLDGAVGNTTQDHVDYAVMMGADRILLIDNSSVESFLWKVLVGLYALFTPHKLRKKIFRKVLTKSTYKTPEGVNIVYIHKNDLPVRIASKGKDKLRNSFELGIQDALNNELQLRVLFSK